MDKAEARARRYLSVAEIFSELSETLESPEPSIARFLLHPIELHKLDFHCKCRIEDGTNQRLPVELSGHEAEEFLTAVATGDDDLKSIEHNFNLHLGADGSGGRWEILPPELLAGLKNSGDEYSGKIPFSQFLVSKVELERRLKDANTQIPPKWINGDAPLGDVKPTQGASLKPTQNGSQEPVFYWYEKDGILYEGLNGNVEETKRRKGEEASETIRDIIRANGEHITAWHLYDNNNKASSEALEGIYTPTEYDRANVVINFAGDGVPNDLRMKGSHRTQYLAAMRDLKEDIEHLQNTGENPALLEDKLAALESIQNYVNSGQHLGGRPRAEFSEDWEKKIAAIGKRIKRKIRALRNRGQAREADYLENSLKIGTECWYEPGGWEIRTDPPGE